MKLNVADVVIGAFCIEYGKFRYINSDGPLMQIEVLIDKYNSVVQAMCRNGKNIYGAAAMKSMAKMLRGNIITGVASVAILSTVDVVNVFGRRISGGQLLKNVANTTATTIGGTVGRIVMLKC